MPDFTFTLPSEPAPNAQIMVPLPGGEYQAPEGWKISDGFLTTWWKAGMSTEVTAPTVPEVLCGLCALPILATDLTTSRRGLLHPVSGDPDAHLACYRKAVEQQVSRPGGPASPYPAPVPAWTPDLVITVGELYTYDGVTYRALTGHTSKAGTPPPADLKLWEVA